MNATFIGLILAIGFASCEKALVEYEQGSIKVCVGQGSEWLHDFPVFLGLTKKNPPQIAIWLEDMQGNYLSTLYVSHKIATQGWQMARGSRRKEALPHWCHSRGVIYDDGLCLPTADKPLTDGISGATPRGSFEVKLKPAGGLTRFIVKVEVNHSADFNDRYPRNAAAGDAGYSGGKEGSGQPALIYRAEVDLQQGPAAVEAALVGHSSPDGSDGAVHTDLSGLTTALEIVDRITVSLQ